MKIHSLFCVIGLLLLNIYGHTQGQGTSVLQPKSIEVSKAVYKGKTPPVNELIKKEKISKIKKAQWKKDNKKPKNFIGRGTSMVVKPELEHQGPDPLRQGKINKGLNKTESTLKVNIDSETSGSPNDPSGDIGKEYYVQAINATIISVFDKSGNLIESFSANTLWASLGFFSAGDPIVLYDQEEDRWLITEFPSGNQLLVAISETNDPLGSYDVYNFQTPSFPDYPKYSIWSDAITVTTNEGGPGVLHAYAINKSQLYNAKDLVDIQRIGLPGNTNTEAGFFVATPVDWTGQNKPKDSSPLFLALDDSSWGNADQDQINIFKLNIDWANSDNTNYTLKSIVTTPFDGNPCSVTGFSFSCVPQPDSQIGLDAIPEVIMNQAIYRNFISHESLVFNFITDVTDGENLSGIRWVELRRTNGEWELYQEGTFSPNDGLDRYMGGICMDGAGNIALAYNVSSEEEFVGVRYTGRKHDDPLGEMTIEEQIIVEGINEINSATRFGDYAQMGIDPVNDKTFWYTTEYAGDGDSDSNTRIIAFEIERDLHDVGVNKLNLEKIGAFTDPQAINLQINNYGSQPAQNINVSYQLDDNPVQTGIMEEIIESGESINFEFDELADLSEAGPHTLISYTSYTSDTLQYNDTLISIINTIGAYDVGLSKISFDQTISCTDQVEGTMEIINNGGEILTSAIISYFVNEVLWKDESWEGNLEFCETDFIDFTLENLPTGESNIKIVVSQPNGELDQQLNDNQQSVLFNYFDSGVEIKISILTDEFPEETSWEILDDAGNVYGSGGDYSIENNLYEEYVCLLEDSCYTFVIYDGFGDGLFEPSYYEVSNEYDDELASLLVQNFGFEETNSFCATNDCFIEVSITTTPEGEDGGSIFLNPINGAGPFMYSIDGGVTFQDNGLFVNLDEGIYDVVVMTESCDYTGIAEVEACNLIVTLDVTDATSQENGSLEVVLENEEQPVEISIDGGITWTDNTMFSNLEAGFYDIIVRDAFGCVFQTMVEIKIVNSNSQHRYGEWIKASPNPTTGILHVELMTQKTNKTFLKYQIINSIGVVIRNATIVKYNDGYVTDLSLYYESSGVYFIRINEPDIQSMVRVIKVK